MKARHIWAAGLLALAAGAAPAAVVSQTLGGVDSFGAGFDVMESTSSGGLFDSLNLPIGGTTDALVETATLNFNQALGGGTVTGATLVIRTGGFGYYGTPKIIVNGVELELTDTDNENALLGYFEERIAVDTFDLFALGIAVDGTDTIELLLQQDDPGFLDAGAIDYAILQITYDAGGGGSAPEPASLALAALALVGAGVARRRRPR